jgi:hypothetical protein
VNRIFLAIVLAAVLFSGWKQVRFEPEEGQASPMEALSAAMVESAGGAVELAIGLVGVMTLFLGLMKVAEAGGMLTILARLIRPLMVRLFPEVPADHPAMGAMILNLSANALGLGNAATPFRHPRHAGTRSSEPAPGNHNQRHGPVSGRQHLQRDPAAHRRHRPARRSGQRRSSGHSAHHLAGHHRLNQRGHCGKPNSTNASAPDRNRQRT